jgi:peptide deformylase
MEGGDMPIEELVRIGVPRPIVRWGEPVLHTPARPVTDFGHDLQVLIADLFATNRAADGAGLAAPQIGVDLAVFVYDCRDEHRRRRVGVICNPSVSTPDGPHRRLEADGEGCLSLPGAYATLARPYLATCRGQDQYGEAMEVTAGGTLGRCLQHEADHLAGTVFGDRLSRRDRQRLYAMHGEVAAQFPHDWPVQPRR